MRIARISPIDDPRWLAFIEAACTASVFHHPAWLELIARRYRYTMSALCVLDAGGDILAGIPLARVESRLTGRRLVAIPFSDACPPALAASADDNAMDALAAAIIDERKRTGLDVEVRWRLNGIDGAHIADRFLVHRLSLEQDADAVLARASKSQVRRAIAKSEHEGVLVRRAVDRQGLEQFYALHTQTRRRQLVPVQSKRFILDFEALFAAGLGFVMISSHEGKAIAAAVFLTFADTVTYKYGASDERHLALRPNHALFAQAIRDGCAAGFRELDFGRTDPNNEGLARFKRSWGADEDRLGYTYLAEAPPGPTSPLAERLVASAIKRGPRPTGRLIGSALYRHIG